MMNSKKLENCPILVAKCEAVRHAISASIRIQVPQVSIYSDSQIVVNEGNGKMTVSKIL